MPPKTRALLEALEAELGTGAVLTGEAVSESAQGIWRPAPLEALAIARPKDTREVSFVLRACFEAGQSVIPQGGLTGLVHGADTGPEDLILSLERMNAIEEIDQAGRTVRVQAGVPLQTLQETVAEQGLSFPLDLGARLLLPGRELIHQRWGQPRAALRHGPGKYPWGGSGAGRWHGHR